MFLPGNPGGPGRPKGGVNKDKKTVRSIVEGILGKSIPEELIELTKGNKDKRIQILSELLPYTYAKIATKEISPESENESSVDPVLVAKIVQLLKMRVREEDPS